MLVSCGLVVADSTLAVWRRAKLAPPITQAPTAANPIALVAAEAPPVPSPSSTLAAPPSFPWASFLPASTIRPGCEATVQTLPTSPLTIPAAEHNGFAGLRAEAGGGLAQKAKPAVTADSATSVLARLGVIWRSFRGAGRS